MNTKGDIRIRIMQDDMGNSPREWDNLGTMVCFHNRYELGDKHEFKDPEEFESKCGSGLLITLSLYLYDHSGISMSTGREYPFNCPWDSGQVGWIYCTMKDIIKEYGKATQEEVDRARAAMQAEVEVYNQFLTGDVYGFVIEKFHKCDECGNEEWESVDSCWGFYGFDVEKSGMLDHVDKEYHTMLKAVEEVSDV